MINRHSFLTFSSFLILASSAQRILFQNCLGFFACFFLPSLNWPVLQCYQWFSPCGKTSTFMKPSHYCRLWQWHVYFKNVLDLARCCEVGCLHRKSSVLIHLSCLPGLLMFLSSPVHLNFLRMNQNCWFGQSWSFCHQSELSFGFQPKDGRLQLHWQLFGLHIEFPSYEVHVQHLQQTPDLSSASFVMKWWAPENGPLNKNV